MIKPISGYIVVASIFCITFYGLYKAFTMPPSLRTLAYACPTREELVEQYYQIAATRPLKKYEKDRYTEHLIYLQKYCN